MYKICRLRKWKIVLIVFVILFGILIQMRLYMLSAFVNNMFELEKCPICYGVSTCDYASKITLDQNDFSTILSYLFGIKNVFYGTVNNNKIVIKKLGSDIELKDLDEIGSKFLNYLRKDEMNMDKWTAEVYESIKQQISLQYEKDYLSRLRLCPTTQRLNTLLQKVYSNNREVHRKTLALTIWTLIFINPEPLMLQILPANSGWPVPKYFGACGRVIIEEYVGPPLSHYYHATWSLRMKIASSLLHAANMFTFADADFAFYLTDISADNIAIDSNGVAKFVDLENIIVVDKSFRPKVYELHENNGSSHRADHIMFSCEDICNHQISDHNFYSVCQLLLIPNAVDFSLSEGLLHDLPPDILQQHTSIRYLLQQCHIPNAPFTRIMAGQKLEEIFDTILQKL